MTVLITEINEISGVYTNGFEVVLQDKTVMIYDGSIHFSIPTEDGKLVKEDYTFSGFKFDITPDDELPVVYDVYLCADNTAEVERTEIGGGQLASYSGTKELLHCICTFVVHPNCYSLDDVDVYLRLLKAKDEVQ